MQTPITNDTFFQDTEIVQLTLLQKQKKMFWKSVHKSTSVHFVH